MLLSGADIIVKTLIEQGCDTVFGYPGGQILGVYDALYRHRENIRHILTAHEQGAAHAADGYARATGRVGVVISTSGPGATNLVTGIATAHMDSIPVVAICGNVPTNQIGTDSFQEIDITGITLPITKHNYFVSDVSRLADTVREAFALAMSGRPGPVLVDVPKDVQAALAEYTPMEAVTPEVPVPAKDIRISDAAECINDSRRPYIYFGGGVLSGNAIEEMKQLAELIDAPMGCSLMGLSALPSGAARFLGMQGMHGDYAASVAMQNADCIIALGVRFNDRVTGDRDKFAAGARIVHIDIDGSELSKTVHAHHGLRGDIKATLTKLLPLVRPARHEWWNDRVNELKQKAAVNADRRAGFTPQNIIGTLNGYLGDNTAVATDVGQHQMWTAQSIKLKKPRRFLTSGGLGTMGFGLGAAIGAAFGTGERSVLVTGDGSFGMSLCELATAVSCNVPIVIVIMNNGALGMVRQWQSFFFDGRYSESLLDRKTDFAALARAFGADGERASDIAGLSAALDRAFGSDGVYIVDCAVDTEELVLPMLPPGGSMTDIIVKAGE